MQIKLGEKIKELRKRDGRKQEDLAVALGVTNQAVSRWEANGGYPDIEMLPAIANYFHITIDELFGYDNDRQTKLQAYIEKADQMSSMTILKPIPEADSAQRVEFLRNAISEFPSEWQLQSRLADALAAMGNEKREQSRVVEAGDNVRYSAQNECWKEATSLYEEVLKNEIDNERRSSVTTSLMWLYSQMGDLENAERIILSQSPVDFSREVLLAKVLRNEKTEEYRAEAILALMHELYMVILQSVMAEYSLAHSQAGLDTLLTVAGLYECIFGNVEYGIYHNDMSELYLNCSSVAIELNDSEHALKYLETGLDHYLEFRKTREKIQFEAPLIHKAKNYGPNIVLLRRKDFEDYMQSFSPECVDAIRNNPRYAPLLAE